MGADQNLIQTTVKRESDEWILGLAQPADAAMPISHYQGAV
jgi:hypothetical protein